MSLFDRVLRGVALTSAVAVVAVAALNSQMPINLGSAVRAEPRGGGSEKVSRSSDAIQPQGYSYLLSSPDHRYPARWCPGTIGYYVDTTLLADSGMSAGQEILRWEEVFRAWSTASQGRYTFAYLGEREFQMNSDSDPDVNSVEPGTIGITYVLGNSDGEPADYRANAVGGRTAGNGGLQVTSTGDTEATALVGDRGFVMIDTADAADLPADGLRRSLYQHESGHALGLGHVDDDRSLMNGTLSTARSTITGGDSAGLRSLAEMPCVE
jgi:hypothetical protein